MGEIVAVTILASSVYVSEDCPYPLFFGIIKGLMDKKERIQRLLAGDEEAYVQLVSEYQKPLLNFIYRFVNDRYLAEDIFQETFVRLVRSFKTYKKQYGLKTWVFTIAKNLCLDYLKSKKHKGQVSLETKVSDEGKLLQLKDVLESGNERPDETAESRQYTVILREAVGSLPVSVKDAFILRYYCGMSYDSIADTLSISVGTAKFRVHTAVKELARLVKKIKLRYGGIV